MTHSGDGMAPAWRAPFIVGIVLLLLAAVTMLDAFRLVVSTGPGVGPSVAMKLIAVLLALLGAGHLVEAARKYGKGADPGAEPAANVGALAWVLAGLVLQIVALALGAGFIVTSTILFVATARGFGRPLLWRSPLLGLALSTAVYVFFTKALSLSLPAGPLERLLFG